MIQPIAFEIAPEPSKTPAVEAPKEDRAFERHLTEAHDRIEPHTRGEARVEPREEAPERLREPDEDPEPTANTAAIIPLAQVPVDIQTTPVALVETAPIATENRLARLSDAGFRGMTTDPARAAIDPESLAPKAHAMDVSETPETAAPAKTDAAEDADWRLWASRRLQSGDGADAELPEDGGEPAGGPSLDALDLDGPAGAESRMGGEPRSGEGGQKGSSGPRVQEGAVRFEIAGPNADVLRDAVGSRPGAPARSGAAGLAREIVRMKTHAQGSTSTAEVSLSIDGEEVTVRVRIDGNRVDVDIRGLEAADMTKLRQQLRPELDKHQLDLGQLREDAASGGDGHPHQREDSAGSPQLRQDRDQRMESAGPQPEALSPDAPKGHQGVWIQA